MQTLLEAAKNLLPSAAQIGYLQRLEDGSAFMARLLAKDTELLKDLLNHVHLAYPLPEMQQFLAKQTIIDEASLKKSLRLLRQHVLARLITRDLNGLADLHEVMQTTSQLAEIAIQTAATYLQAWLEDDFGKPLSADGKPQQLIVIGMGKLGGGELNVSSDVDLIFAYEQEGETSGPSAISNQVFFNKLGKKVISALDEVTADGFVFRVDMRLRPFGSEGALVSSLDALEEYYQNNGREWERYAWIKGRVVIGSQASITQLLKPFVFRKYLDFGAFASMRDLKIQIQRDVVKKGLEDNIKLGRGGIREIEFIAQVFQLIRGGQDASLQIRPTLQVLQRLQEKNLLNAQAAQVLTAAYVFLRNLEHRLMYLEDAQTQELPKQEATQLRIAKAMNYENWHDFMRALNTHREHVRSHFDATFSLSAAHPADGQSYLLAKSIWLDAQEEASALSKLAALGFVDTKNTLQRIEQLHQSHRFKQLPDLSRQRFDAVFPLLIEAAGKQVNPDIALSRGMDLLEAICRRASYLALLAEYPQALRLVIKLCSASSWCAQYLTQHPILLDELLIESALYAAPDFNAMKNELQANMDALVGDTERQMDGMRQFKHAMVFRFAAQDIAGKLSLETLSDYLSALADLILEVSLQTIWQSLKFKHLEKPKFAVIGYGKLGGRELAYASDLDIIFLYDDDASVASEHYGRFAQRINNWFNSLTAAGMLYETDLQLRPDGNSGLLVSAIDAFYDYQQHRAWTWEHQALTRARFVAGDAAIGARFEAIRQQILQVPRDLTTLRRDIIEMRAKMLLSHQVKSGLFDVKFDRGGIIDVEFIVQYWVLGFAAAHAELTENIGNIALLKRLADLGLIAPDSAQAVQGAYLQYRAWIHAAKLQGSNATIEDALAASHKDAVMVLWQMTFEQAKSG